MCPRRTEKFKQLIKDQFMEKRIFEKIIEECAKHKLFSIRLSLRGESFMHPQIFDFIELIKKTGIKEVASLTNGLALTPGKFERLVQLKFDWLTISVDGLGSTYESIRKPAKFKEAFEKIKIYHQIKKRYNSSKPMVKIQAVWSAIKDNPEEFYRTFSPYVDLIASNPLIDFSRANKHIGYDENFQCPYLYQRMVIAANGSVLLCSCDDYGEYIIGDVRNESIYEIWHGRKMNAARKWFKKGNRVWRENAPCKYCFYPRKKEKAEDALIEGRKVAVERYVNRREDVLV
ncbi:MAG: SPASM domain-containing protein [Candidatus Omnitrophota bacterium]|nr:MAG: SPASM domain-containing protein [Candidatus Omnitrophota bacterium]